MQYPPPFRQLHIDFWGEWICRGECIYRLSVYCKKQCALHHNVLFTVYNELLLSFHFWNWIAFCASCINCGWVLLLQTMFMLFCTGSALQQSDSWTFSCCSCLSHWMPRTTHVRSGYSECVSVLALNNLVFYWCPRCIVFKNAVMKKW